jgi:cell division protein FtsW
MNATRLGPRPTTSRRNQSYKNALRTPVKKEGPGLRKHRPDYMIVIYMTILLAVGAVTVYAISPGITTGKNLSENFFSIKQLTAIGLGAIAFIIASLLDTKTWKKLEIPLIVLAVVVAIAVRLIGEEVNGAYRWLQVGGLSFQAAELIKFTLVIWLAGYLARVRIDKKTDSNEVLKVLGIIIVVIGFVVAGLQSDLGSAAVMMAIIAFMAFIAGLPLKKLFIVGSIVLLLSTIAIVSSPYRIDRVSTFLNPTADCQNEGYQACQALITVGSGGLFGKGLGRSVQAYGYLPEAANDSIFAIVSEKFGFIGSAIILGVFVGLFKRIKNVAQNAPNDYSRLLVSGILAWLSVQMMINIGAMIGLLPLKGITLPFVSYGGTSIIFVMAAVGIVFHISRYTDLTRATKSNSREYGPNNNYSRETTRLSRARSM